MASEETPLGRLCSASARDIGTGDAEEKIAQRLDWAEGEYQLGDLLKALFRLRNDECGARKALGSDHPAAGAFRRRIHAIVEQATPAQRQLLRCYDRVAALSPGPDAYNTSIHAAAQGCVGELAQAFPGSYLEQASLLENLIIRGERSGQADKVKGLNDTDDRLARWGLRRLAPPADNLPATVAAYAGAHEVLDTYEAAQQRIWDLQASGFLRASIDPCHGGEQTRSLDKPEGELRKKVEAEQAAIRRALAQLERKGAGADPARIFLLLALDDTLSLPSAMTLADRLRESERVLGQAREVADRLGGDGAKWAALISFRLGRTLNARGKASAAIPFLLQVESLGSAPVAGPSIDPTLVRTLLLSSEAASGNRTSATLLAAELIGEAAEPGRCNAIARASELADALGTLARSLVWDGRIGDALPLQQRVVDFRDAAYGNVAGGSRELWTKLAASYLDKAGLLVRAGQPDEAEAAANSGLALISTDAGDVRGRDRRLIAQGQLALGDANWMRGDLKASMTSYDLASADIRSGSSLADVRWSSLRLRLGVRALDAADFATAAKELGHVRLVRERELSATHPETIEAIGWLAELALRRNDVDEALQLARRASSSRTVEP